VSVLDGLEDCDVLVADVTTLEDCLRRAPNLFDASLLKVVLCVDEADACLEAAAGLVSTLTPRRFACCWGRRSKSPSWASLGTL